MPDVPVTIDVPATIDVPDVPVIIDRPPVDRPPVDRPFGACRWVAGPLVDPVVPPSGALRLLDAVPYGDGVALVVDRRPEATLDARIELYVLDPDGHPERDPLVLGPTAPSDYRTAASLAVRAGSDEIAVLSSRPDGAFLDLVAATGRARHVDLTATSSRALRLLASPTGYSFDRVLPASPRIHQVELDASGAVRGEATLPISVGPPRADFVGEVDPLIALQRFEALDGRLVTLSGEALESSLPGGSRVQFTYATTTSGSASVFDGRDLRGGVAALPGAAGTLFAYVRQYSIMRVSLIDTTFAVQPVDLRGSPTGPVVVWPLRNFGYLPAAAGMSAGGPMAVVPIVGATSLPFAFPVERFVARAIAPDGTPAGDALTLPLPTEGVSMTHMIVAPTTSGAMVFMTVSGGDELRERAVGVALRCE